MFFAQMWDISDPVCVEKMHTESGILKSVFGQIRYIYDMYWISAKRNIIKTQSIEFPCHSDLIKCEAHANLSMFTALWFGHGMEYPNSTKKTQRVGTGFQPMTLSLWLTTVQPLLRSQILNPFFAHLGCLQSKLCKGNYQIWALSK